MKSHNKMKLFSVTLPLECIILEFLDEGCYGLDRVCPPHSYAEALTSSVTIFGDRTFKEGT